MDNFSIGAFLMFLLSSIGCEEPIDILMWASHVVSALLLWVSGSLRRLPSRRGNGGP